MKPRIAIRLFGRLSVRLGEEKLLVRTSAKPQELFAYLAVHRQRPHSREALASFLWNGRPSHRTLNSLRQTLWKLKLGLLGRTGEGACRLLAVDAHWIEFSLDDRVSLDVVEFEDELRESGCSATGNSVDRLEKAVRLYDGEFLEGCYAEWCLRERERLRQLCLTALDQLVNISETLGKIDSGIALAMRALELDPGRESSHRALMRMFYRREDRGAALQQYDLCRAALKSDFGIGPDEETRALAGAIQVGRSIGSTSSTDSRVSPLAPGLGTLAPVNMPPRRTVARGSRGANRERE